MFLSMSNVCLHKTGHRSIALKRKKRTDEEEKDENLSFSETDFEDETSLFEEFDKA